MKNLALAIIAIGLAVLGAALLQPSGKEKEPVDTRDHYVIAATIGGTTERATAMCEGDTAGTGYLADPKAAFDACTFDKVVSIHQYLQHRASCDDLIRDAATAPSRLLGKVTITGLYFDEPLKVTLDAEHGTACDRAAWKLLGPLLPE